MHEEMWLDDDEDLLLEWVKKRGPPNRHEVRMLAKYTNVARRDIEEWC